MLTLPSSFFLEIWDIDYISGMCKKDKPYLAQSYYSKSRNLLSAILRSSITMGFASTLKSPSRALYRATHAFSVAN